MKIVKRIISIIFLIYAVLGAIILITDEKPDVGTTIAQISISFVIGLVFWLWSNKKTKATDERLINKPLADASMHHVEGLPVAEKTLCTLSLHPEKVTVVGGGTEFNINLSQIRAAEIKTDVEIAHIVNSSAAKGIAGGLLFGPIGLVVGARATSKEKRTATFYFILNYTNSAGEVAAIMFDAGHSGSAAQKIVNKLKPLIKVNPKQTVQL